jgi:hypothetical protein
VDTAFWRQWWAQADSAVKAVERRHPALWTLGYGCTMGAILSVPWNVVYGFDGLRTFLFLLAGVVGNVIAALLVGTARYLRRSIRDE